MVGYAFERTSRTLLRFLETAWRKTPRYQGGFLLDGGVHFIAGTRLLLGPENEPVKVSAFSSQLQKHLPPVDTVDAVWQLKSGISGTFTCSFGTTFEGDEYAVSCEKGTVIISKGIVTVKPVAGSRIEAIDGKDLWQGPGIQEEIEAWASGISSGKIDQRLSPEEALMDLKIVSPVSLKLCRIC
jgi:predicted dehydrogenase